MGFQAFWRKPSQRVTMCLFFLNLPFNQLLFLKKYEGGSVFLDLQGPTGSLSEKKS